MIIYVADGRLGNQIFQYAFLKTIQRSNERIFVFGLDELMEMFEIHDSLVINISGKNKTVRRIVYRLFRPMIEKLSEYGLFSRIYVVREPVLNGFERESTEYKEEKGVFSRVKFVKSGFFQSESFFDSKVIRNLKIKNKYVKDASEFMKSKRELHNVFVHIRRGDYKNYTVYGAGTLLPMKYFHDQIKWFIREKGNKNVHFIFMSDEPDFIEKEFFYLDNKTISRNSDKVDFAIMTLCDSAILSPSSFGWWGSYFIKKKDTVLAPKYWLGFNRRKSYHKSPLAAYMIGVDIEDN